MSGAREGSGQPFSARDENRALNDQWRTLRRVATLVAVVTAPLAFFWLYEQQDWSLGWSILTTCIPAFALRSLIKITFRSFVPWRTPFGMDDT